MKYVLTPAEMRDMEARYMLQEEISSLTLMERAAGAMADELIKRLGGAEGKTCVFLCGPGGNGGDGYECARRFAARGGRAVILDALPEASRREDALYMRMRALETKGVWLSESVKDMPRPSAWVDAAFGTGLSRAPEHSLAALFDRIACDRERGSLVISCDIPSGIDGLTGESYGASVRADVTVTFQCEKTGHFLGDGMDAAGELVCVDIGIPDAYLPVDALRLAEPFDIAPFCAPRKRNSHKGTYGHLLLIAGSRGMAGAACLAAGAALRSGAGLVTVACPESVMPIVQSLEPCAMCVPLPENEGAISAEAAPLLRETLLRKTAFAIGPGLSGRCAPEIVRVALASGLPGVLDADALNLISANLSLKELLHENCVLTPHPGEAARLISLLPKDPLQAARSLRIQNCTALYKGAATLICGKSGMFMSISGTPGMARGGSGDVLTGIVGALLSRGVEPETAAWAASEAHGLAGEKAALAMGEIGMTASDILKHLPAVWSEYA